MRDVIKLVEEVLAACGGSDEKWMTWAMNYDGSKKGARGLASHASGYASGVLNGMGMHEVDLVSFLPDQGKRGKTIADAPYLYLAARAREEAVQAAAAMIDRRRAYHLECGRRFLERAIAAKARSAKTHARATSQKLKVLERE